MALRGSKDSLGECLSWILPVAGSHETRRAADRSGSGTSPCLLIRLDYLLIVEQEFEYEPSDEEWAAFLEKTRYVRTFKTPGTGGGLVTLSESAVAAIARTRPLQPIFPALRNFNMVGLGTRKLFMSPTVKQFLWCFAAEDVQFDMARLCAEIAHAMPNIEVFTVKAPTFQPLQAQLAWLYEHLIHLQRISLPLYGLSFPVLQSLLSLERLEEVKFHKEWPCCAPYLLRGPVEEDWPRSYEGIPYRASKIRSLKVLCIGMPTLDQFLRLIRWGSPMLGSVTELTVRIAYPIVTGGMGRQVYELGTLLAIHAKNLQDLTLYLASRDGPVVDEEAGSLRVVELHDIQPLLSLPLLHSFGIHLDQVLCLNDSDMRIIASSLPNARTIILNPHPTILSPSLVTWRSLMWFAIYCPHILELGLYVDGAVEVEWYSKSSFSPSFRRLRLGRSSLPGRDDHLGQQLVASCLGDLLTLSTEVLCLCVEDILDVDVAIPDRDSDSEHPFWRIWCREMGVKWSEIALLVRAVMEERLLRSKEKI